MFRPGSSSRRIARFGLVGGANTGIDYGVFALLTFAGVPLLLAQCFSYGCGMSNSYLLNRRWTFRDRMSSSGSITRFAVVNLAVLAVTSTLLALLCRRLGWSALAGKGVATAAGLVLNYAGSNLWAFRDSGPRSRFNPQSQSNLEER